MEKIKATTLIKRVFYIIRWEANGMACEAAAQNDYNVHRCIFKMITLTSVLNISCAVYK